ncbi:MAG TPA: galactosyltransferase-related protein, partial [Bacteroidia bacterium]|nr:galactosyltransferase-related protein [Bacteroidia bacterium]
NVPWNMSRANNLGFSKLKENDIVLRLDIDHWFSLEDLEKLSEIKLKPKEIIKFNRIVLSKRKYKTTPPPNIYMARVGDLINVGGYDERFCGNYGYEDKELMHRLKNNGFKETISEVLVKTKASLHTKGLNRDLTVNRELYLELIKQK